MRLHRMTMTAFGPYPGSCAIDFDELSAAGLFLLHGATGAGKTSVLDAVCYALYAGVPGARQGLRPRSDHADPDVLTEVVLEFSAGGRRLELTRRPEQHRPKKRGAGTTLEKAYSALREHLPGTGEWKALSRSHQEIGEEIAQLLGMSREQFCQVVLLPQGDFSRFLRSDARDRAELLGKLFDTHRFEAVESWLNERRKEAEERVRAHDELLVALAHRMRQAAGDVSTQAASSPSHTTAPAAVPAARGATADRARRAGAETRSGEPWPFPGMAPGDPALADDVLTWAAITRATARERHDIAALALDAAEGAHREAERLLERDRATAERQRRLAEAEARLARLHDERDAYERACHRLERAAAADQVTPALAARDRAARDHHQASRRLRDALATLPPDAQPSDVGHSRPDASPPDAGEPYRDEAGLAERERQVRRELGRLEAARAAEARAHRLTAERAGLEHETTRAEALDQDTAQWLADWDALRAALRRRLDAAQEAATRAEQLAGRLEPARRRLRAAAARDELAAAEDAARGPLLAARETAAAVRERWLDLREARLRGIAAELATALVDGEPCPVCGGADHPRPAVPGAQHVDRAAEERAQAAHDHAEGERARLEAELLALRERRAAAEAEVGDAPAHELASRLAGWERDHAEARRAAADAHPAREELDRAEREHARRLEEQRETQTRAAARVSRREALDGELAALTAQVNGARGSHGSVAERISRLESLALALCEATDAARDHAATADRLADAEQRLTETAREAGFADPREATEATLDETLRRELAARVQEHDRRLAAAEEVVADPAVRDAAQLPPADPAARRGELDAAIERLRRASAAEAAAAQRRVELDRLSAQAARRTAEMAPLREEHAGLRRLAQLAAGTSQENELKMRLESYVLAARLEQVAAAASVRLRRMSSGRYTLVHTDARGPGRVRSGLGLRVVDAWTGTERDTATLSGGETFFASLALALGLADVVTDEAGAVRLDTLFIDEGFGSLDDQTLDEVLDVLDALRERDRAVGIVSHVSDLRHRIPAQLEVIKHRHGSSVRHRTAAGERTAHA
ncbi:SMC family ATPase [Streptomyces sp. PTM05]|uniref:Nuclease SbcCD subunit C n=1 Tax=Streptantibioticus parmotrematis TaxID=2873249 RepID=A0ABS7QJY1_9ACTN|nr:SMC family ATPase [Streptantibioticus parmotrematis]MBY8883248.1 SMC family ATPase [Streptantibioticus parmotrematis]